MIVYTDGSAFPNPGPGGWSVIDAKTKTPLAIGREPYSTNICMEGTAILNAIRVAGNEKITIYTDSQFWINVLTKWAPSWERNNWHKKTGPIKNLELVKKLYTMYTTHNVKLQWVRGHVGTELNELADEWAKKARCGAEL